MPRYVISLGLAVCAAAVVFVVYAGRGSSAQEVCRGDVNGDGRVTTADAASLVPLLFQGTDIDPALAIRADANDDGAVGGADVVAILLQNDAPCALATPTPSHSPTPTRSPTTAVPGNSPTPTKTPTVTATVPTRTPTATLTPRPTATPTQVCEVRTVSLGDTNAELTAGDCQRVFGGQLRVTDEYSIVGTPGQAIKVEVTSTSASGVISPYVSIIDPNGQFDRADRLPPAEFVVTTSAHPYEIFVTTAPNSLEQFGPYKLTLSARPCPTPEALAFSSVQLGRTLDGTTACPDPATVATRNALNPVDLYSFTVTQVPTNVQIIMRQRFEEDDIDPTFSVIGPDGYEVVTTDLVDDAAGGLLGLDAGARFLALQTGTYTVIAQGGTGRYSFQLSSPPCTVPSVRLLTNIPLDHPLSRTGTLYGDTSKTTCGAPLPMPGISDDVPDPNAAADLYSFTGRAGDVISVEMDTDDDAHLYLLGPSSAGNPLVTQDDDSSPNGSQVAATLVADGTYTIVAAVNSALQPPIPADQDPGDIINYTLFVQKCPVTGALDPTAGSVVSSSFGPQDCVGFGGLPFRTYAFGGTAGQFVTARMRSDALDSAVRILAPDGSQVANDNDPFNMLGNDARANRILPVNGTYFVEVSASIDAGSVDLSSLPRFTLQANSCTPTLITPGGAVSGAFQDGDCDLGNGRKYDVYTFAGLTGAGSPPRVASLLAPSNGCVLAMLAEGVQTPGDGCSAGMTEIPLLSSGLYGFIVAGADAATRGAYTAQLRSCPLSVVGYGDVRLGALNGGNCTAANGARADWYLIRANAGLVRFNDGIFGAVHASFPVGGLITDLMGGVGFSGVFSDYPEALFAFGNDLAALLKVTGASPSDRGSYTLAVDQAEYRQ